MIPLHKPFIPPWGELGPALQAVFESGQISQGAEVNLFEHRFGEFIGNPNVVAVSSCTAALHLALELAGARGGEVVSTPMTAEPTNLAIHYAGARVRWADVDPLTGNVTGQSIGNVLVPPNGNVRAILLVHYGGIPVEDDGIKVRAHNFKIPIIEDCAHALGASPIGWGDYQCYSFQAIKHMTTGGEGGALVIPEADDETMRRAQKLRWFGIDRAVPRTSMDIQEAGLKYNLTNVQAAVGLVALDELYEKLNATEANCRWYKECLDVPGVYHYTRMDFSPYLFYTILAERRDDLACKLTEAGVECGQAHRRNDEHTVFAYAKRPLPGLDAYYSKMLHIPCGWWVTPEDRQYILGVIGSGW